MNVNQQIGLGLHRRLCLGSDNPLAGNALHNGEDGHLSLAQTPYTELLARVKGLLRRYKVYKGDARSEASRFIEWRGIKLDCERNEVWKDGKEINLTEKAYQILKLLLVHRGKIFSAQNLYESVWEEPYYAPSSNTVMVHIRKLREKIEESPQEPKILKTIWGKGYRSRGIGIPTIQMLMFQNSGRMDITQSGNIYSCTMWFQKVE